ncbi:hypothetical protein R5R35_007471 [Gryllus longicercus]|uniref:Ubiquitin carboxyl-terminal hydrolase n=1 Tax=Gryllus longicercus TaxID=2509291 RepID=A0AAN9VI08_9ORTH|nr:Ubiquitin carboxyl-terminal hydrolase [Gryllus bimaculatus]
MAWLPLESNPDVMNKYLYNLGVPDKYQMVDVYGLDNELLGAIPRPVLAVMLLFPSRKTQDQPEIDEAGDKEVSESLFYIKQIVNNACGTIALLHSVANNLDKIQLEEGHLKTFIEKAKPLNPMERGELLGKAEGIINIHKEVAMEGQTEAPEPTEPVHYHFVAFVQQGGFIYELDGRKPSPINHGCTSDDTFLEDAARVCKQYMDRDPDELHFTVVALTAT